MIARQLFVVCLLNSWIVSTSWIISPGDMPYTDKAAMLGSPWSWRRIAVMVPLTLLFLGLSEAWALGYFPVGTGVGVLAMLLAIRQWEKSLWPGDIVVKLGKYVPAAACLAGYTVVYALADGTHEQRLQLGWEGSWGVMGSIFTLGALWKWGEGGLAWLGGRGLALLVAERAYGGARVWKAARLWMSSNLLWCRVLSVTTVVLQSLGVITWYPGVRIPYAVLMVSFLSGVAVFLGYFETEWILLLLTLCLAAGGGP